MSAPNRARYLEQRAEQLGGALQALRMHGDATRAMAKAMLAADGQITTERLAQADNLGPSNEALRVAAGLVRAWVAEVEAHLAGDPMYTPRPELKP